MIEVAINVLVAIALVAIPVVLAELAAMAIREIR